MAKRNATVTVDGRTVTVDRNADASEGCYAVTGLCGDYDWDCATGEIVGGPREIMMDAEWARLEAALCAELDRVRLGR